MKGPLHIVHRLRRWLASAAPRLDRTGPAGTARSAAGLLRWRRHGMALLVVIWAASGLACILHAAVPVGSWSLPQLHARCLGLLHLALALLAWPGTRSTDGALARVPLIASLLFAAASLAAVVRDRTDLPAPWHWAWPSVMGLILVASSISLLIDRELQAPAQRPLVAWSALACAAAAVGAASLLWPAPLAAVWPWQLATALAWIYGPPLLAHAAVFALLARERRAYVRRAVERPLALLAGAVLAVSLWHLHAFDLRRWGAWVWLASFALMLGLALRSPWQRRSRR